MFKNIYTYQINVVGRFISILWLDLLFVRVSMEDFNTLNYEALMDSLFV